MAEKTNVPEIRFAGFTDPWEQRKLGEVAPVTMGQSPNGACYTDNPNDAVLVQGNADLKDGWVYPRVWTTEITKTAKSGDLIMSVRAPVGAMGKTAYDVVLGRGVAGIVGNEFLFQALSKKETEGYWSIVSAGSTFDSINGDELRNTPIDCPRSEPECEAIGSCLSKIDQLITLHQRKYDKLCAVKKSMLDKMFPKPGETKPEIRFDGFTDPWEQHKLGELGFAQSGIGFPDVEQGGTEGMPFFKVSDMNTPGNEYELVASNNYVTAEQIARMGWRPINQVPAIFFAKVGAAVMLNRKRLVNEPFLLDNNTMAFSMDSSLLDTQFGRSLFERLDLTSLIQVGALPSFNSSDVESISVSLPSTMNEQRQIGQYLCDLNTLITLHQRKLNLLRNTKKSLLDKMFV